MFLSSSPFTTNVEPGVDASRVRLSGAGVQDNIPASLPVTFLIDTREAGIADLEVLIKVRLKFIQRESERGLALLWISHAFTPLLCVRN